MRSEGLSDFADLDRYYPGSKELRRTVPMVETVRTVDLADMVIGQLPKPVVMTVKGRDVEFFYIGSLAKALGRSAITLRRWEDNGVIPRSGYTKPSSDPRGKRRLYSRQQVEGIIRIANDEGLLEKKTTLTVRFTERVTELFRELKRVRAA